uniref:Transmembrane protein 119b n=1 Tax=Nothobranchius rachovii TaxID=451742 RepID=A0A1A8QA20_9TELE
MHPRALHHIGLYVAFYFSRCLATSLPLYISLEGSTDEEEISYINASVSTRIIPTEYQTTPVHPAREPDFPKQLMDILKENMLLILVANSLIFLAFLIICGAVCMSRRHKVNSYYPSSFPSKMYVDHRDKTGGATPFNEVQERASPKQDHEPVSSHKQLQAEIMRAASSLRTPNKNMNAAERSEPFQKEEDHSSEDGCTPDHRFLDHQQLPTLPEEQQQLPEAAGSSEMEQPYKVEEDSKEASGGRSLRPSSLHIHNDTATLQLIAGEKTAF